MGRLFLANNNAKIGYQKHRLCIKLTLASRALFSIKKKLRYLPQNSHKLIDFSGCILYYPEMIERIKNLLIRRLCIRLLITNGFMILLASCSTDKVNEVSQQDEVGWVMVTAAPPIPWSQISQALTPSFTDSADTMLSKVGPVTGAYSYSAINNFTGQLQVGLPTAAVSTNSSTTTPSNTSTYTTSTTNPASSAPSSVANSTLTSLTPTTTLSSNSTTPAISLPALNAGTANNPTANNSVLGTTLGIDPMLQYSGANALFQEVAILNNYLSGLEKDWGNGGRRAYVVTFHIVVSPQQRNMPYDTYIDLSIVKHGSGTGEPQLPMLDVISSSNSAMIEDGHDSVQVIPLLATDSIESLLASSSQQNSQSLSLGFAAAISSLPVGAQLTDLNQVLSQMVGKQWNSTLLIGSMGKNTIRIRLGALLTEIGSKPSYVTVPMSHDISVIVLAPRDTNSLRVLTSRTFTEANHAKSPRQMSRSEIVDATMKAYDKSIGKLASPAQPNLKDDYGDFLFNQQSAVNELIFKKYDDLLEQFVNGDFAGFSKNVNGAFAKVGVLNKTATNDYADKVATQLWEVFANNRNLSPYTITDIELGDNRPSNLYPSFPGIENSQVANIDKPNLDSITASAPDGMFLALNNGHLQAVLGGGHHFESIQNLSASLTLSVANGQNKWQSMLLFADTCQAQSVVVAAGSAPGEETLINLAFPLPSTFDLFGSNSQTKGSGTIDILADNRHIKYTDVPIADLTGLPGFGLLPPSLDKGAMFTIGDKGSTLGLQGGQRLDLMRQPSAVLTVQPNLAAMADALVVSAIKIIDASNITSSDLNAVIGQIKDLGSQANLVASNAASLATQAATKDPQASFNTASDQINAIKTYPADFDGLADALSKLKNNELHDETLKLKEQSTILITSLSKLTLTEFTNANSTATNLTATAAAFTKAINKLETMPNASPAPDLSSLIAEAKKLADPTRDLSAQSKLLATALRLPDSVSSVHDADALLIQAFRINTMALLWESEVSKQVTEINQQVGKVTQLSGQVTDRANTIKGVEALISDANKLLDYTYEKAAPASQVAGLKQVGEDAMELYNNASKLDGDIYWSSVQMADLSSEAKTLVDAWKKFASEQKTPGDDSRLEELISETGTCAQSAKRETTEYLSKAASIWITQAKRLSAEADAKSQPLAAESPPLAGALAQLSEKEKAFANAYQQQVNNIINLKDHDVDESLFALPTDAEQDLVTAAATVTKEINDFDSDVIKVAKQAVDLSAQVQVQVEAIRDTALRGATPDLSPSEYPSSASTLSPDNSQITFNFPTLTTTAAGALGAAMPGDVVGSLKVSYKFAGIEHLDTPVNGKLIFIAAPPASTAKMLTPLADHISIPGGLLAVSIATSTDPVTIAVQGATITSLMPIGASSPALALQIPIPVPANATGSYSIGFSDLSPDQVITFTITDPLKKSDPNYQPEVETVRVIDLRSK